MSKPNDFVKDVKEIRSRARADLEAGAVTKNYGGTSQPRLCVSFGTSSMRSVR